MAVDRTADLALLRPSAVVSTPPVELIVADVRLGEYVVALMVDIDDFIDTQVGPVVALRWDVPHDPGPVPAMFTNRVAVECTSSRAREIERFVNHQRARPDGTLAIDWDRRHSVRTHSAGLGCAPTPPLVSKADYLVGHAHGWARQ